MKLAQARAQRFPMLVQLVLRVAYRLLQQTDRVFENTWRPRALLRRQYNNSLRTMQTGHYSRRRNRAQSPPKPISAAEAGSGTAVSSKLSIEPWIVVPKNT